MKVNRYELKKDGQTEHVLCDIMKPDEIKRYLRDGYTFGDPVFDYQGEARNDA